LGFAQNTDFENGGLVHPINEGHWRGLSPRKGSHFSKGKTLFHFYVHGEKG